MATFPSDDAISRSLLLVQELDNQSDRGVAIVGVAWIEEALTAAIHAFLEKNKNAWRITKSGIKKDTGLPLNRINNALNRLGRKI